MRRGPSAPSLIPRGARSWKTSEAVSSRQGRSRAGSRSARRPFHGISACSKGAGLVTERRDGNRILYTLAEDRLATSIGRFLSAVCPEQIVLRHTTWRPGAQREGS